MITVVDYGMGNLRSVENALRSLGVGARISSDPQAISKADRLILPGVGAFGAAMRELKARELIEPIQAHLASGKPYLGICLGLQLLFESSEEDGNTPGLGALKGKVLRFPVREGLKVPHMGWNRVARSVECPLLKGIPEGSFFYFVHSYYAQPQDSSLTALQTEYGVRFASMIARGTIFATQFHPEKSQAIGLALLKNFASL
jgi:glutamine amidotransferase